MYTFVVYLHFTAKSAIILMVMLMSKTKKFIKANVFKLVLFLTAVLAITICSKCSPLYPLNNWDDPNCFFTVGKAVANGKIMYKDIYEQKGPVLYFIHTAAYAISHTSFIGIWLLEIIAAFFFLLFSYKMLRFFASHKVIYCMPLIAALTYSSASFVGGDSAEEFCLPFLAYCIYTGICAIKDNRILSSFECIVTGFSMAFVLFVKYTMMGFYIGFIVVFLMWYHEKKQAKELLNCVLNVMKGFLLILIPLIVYFIYYNAFIDLVTVYFHDNLFLYKTETINIPVLKQVINVVIGAGSFAINNPTGFLMSIFALIYIVKYTDKYIRIFFIGTLCSTLFFVYLGGRYYAYYSFIMNSFCALGIVGIKSLVKKRNFGRKSFAAVSIISSVLILLTSRNLSLMRFETEDYPQYRFAKIISQKENASLLNYGFLDGGFYTVCDITPDCRFFCELNIPYEPMYKEQNDTVENALVDFVVTKDENLSSPNYKLVDECKFPYGDGISTYYLYQKRWSE